MTHRATHTKRSLGTATGIAIILLITGAFAGNIWAGDIDNQIEKQSAPGYVGGNTYNTDGSQSVADGVNYNNIVTYHIKIENDGLTSAYQYSVSSTATSGNGWWITYYDAKTDGTNITANITAAGGWLTPAIAQAGSIEIRVEVTPDKSVLGGATKDVLVWSIVTTATDVSDVVKATTTSNPIDKVDNQIEKQSVPGYVGDNVYSTDGSQNVAQNVNNNEIVTYHIKIENDGNTQGVFSITGTNSTAGWWVTYYDAKTNGNPITNNITAVGGWLQIIQAGQALEIRAEVEPITTVAGGAFKSLSIWSCTHTATNISDVVVCTTTVTNMYKVDGQIGTPAYTGDNIYNVDATNQTLPQWLMPNSVVTYLLKIENDGNTNSKFTITGPASGAGWWITYYDNTAGGADITSGWDKVTGLGWLTASLPRDTSKEIRVEITPDLTVAGGTSLNTLMWLTSETDPTKKDTIKATTTVSSVNTADVQIKNLVGDPYVGDTSYLLDGSQTTAQALDNMATVTYYFKIQNDGNVTDALTVTGTASGSGWILTYYDWPGYTNITGAITGTGWSTGALVKAASVEIVVQITPDATISGTTALNSYVWATSSGTITKKDMVKAVTTVNNIRKPDAQVKVAIGDAYTGNGIYNLDGTNQVVTQTTNNSQLITYYIKVENDGNVNNKFTITGTASGGGWWITYYDATTAGTDITSNVTGLGWLTASLVMNASKEIRVEIYPDATVGGGVPKNIYIGTISETDPTKKDTVKTSTTVNNAYAVDAQVKKSTDGAYIGDGIYNLDGTSQAKAQSVNNTQIVTYHIRIQNDGNFNDNFTLTGTAGGSGWFVTYYNNTAGGADITANVTGIGWLTGVLASAATKDIRVEVTPDITIANGATKTLIMVATSGAVTTTKDAVVAATTAVSGATVVLSAGTYNPAASSEITTTTNLTMLQMKITVTTGTEGAKISAVKVTPSGTAK